MSKETFKGHITDIMSILMSFFLIYFENYKTTVTNTLTSCSLYTQVMLILILIKVQYLQNVVFDFEKGSHHPTRNSPIRFHIPPTPFA